MGCVPAFAADRRAPSRSGAKPWPASCNRGLVAGAVVPVSGMSERPVLHRAEERTCPGAFASGVRKVVRCERQDPVIAFGRSEDSPAVPGGSMLPTPRGMLEAGQKQFVHLAMRGQFSYPRQQGRAADSRRARAAAVTGNSEPAGERGNAARADRICRWFGDVLQRTEVRVPFTDDRSIRSNRATDPVSSIIDREGRRRS